jgi:Flp pilus assembly pilin Flp
MQQILSRFSSSPQRRLQAGQAYTEYGIILVLIAITVIGAVTLLGQQVYDMWHHISTSMPR